MSDLRNFEIDLLPSVPLKHIASAFFGGKVAKPKRAKTQPSKFIVPAVVAGVVLGGGAIIGNAVWGDNDTQGVEPSPALTTSQTPTPTGTDETSSPAESEDEVAAAALESCQADVRASDKVIDEATVGVGHWAEHVQAQTDAFANKITADELAAIFTRTRLAGPDDLKRYAAATKKADELDGSCQEIAGAPEDVATKLAECQERATAQESVLKAGAVGMKDWANHQKDMAKSRHEHVPDAQDIWIDAWKAAPPNINAWKKSIKAFEPPQC